MNEENKNQELEKGAALPPSSVIPENELDLMREFFQLQREQVAVQQSELGLQKQQIENAHEFSLKNLDAMVADRADARTGGKSQRRDRLYFAGGVVLVLAFFIGYAMYLNKDVIAIEILKAVVFLLAGGLGGYSIRANKAKEDKDEK